STVRSRFETMMFTVKPPFGSQIQVRQTLNRPKRRLSIFHFLLKEAALSYPSRPLLKIITLYEPDRNQWIEFRKRKV
ncbi:MAG TPA: hypothetical protein VKX17_12640, partial [Planctomycetota bacterium]|nr:hypothetical protein [Planctomycetota bacterium]